MLPSLLGRRHPIRRTLSLVTRTYTHVQANTNPTITNTIHVQHIPDRFNFLSVVCRSLALFTPRRFFSRLVSASSSSRLD